MKQQQFAIKVGKIMAEVTKLVKNSDMFQEGIFLSLSTIVSVEAAGEIPIYMVHTFPSPMYPERHHRGVEMQYVPAGNEMGVVFHPDYTLAQMASVFMVVGFEPDAEPVAIAYQIFDYLFRNNKPEGYTLPMYNF